MSDRELLERAAKAAGIRIRAWIDATPDCYEWAQIEVTDDTHDEGWNPLVDDGDALRLAVALGLCVEFGYCGDDSPVVYCGPAHERRDWPMHANYPDPYATTRRAVVRAAAALAPAE